MGARTEYALNINSQCTNSMLVIEASHNGLVSICWLKSKSYRDSNSVVTVSKS